MLALSSIGLIQENEDLNLQNANDSFTNLDDVVKVCNGFAPFIIPTLNMLNAISVDSNEEVA